MSKIDAERRAQAPAPPGKKSHDEAKSTQKRLPIDWDERAKRRAADAERYGASANASGGFRRDRERERGDLARARARARRHERVRVAGGGFRSKIGFVARGGSSGVRGGCLAVARVGRQMSMTSPASSTSRDARVRVVILPRSHFFIVRGSSSRRARRVRRVAFRRRSSARATPADRLSSAERDCYHREMSRALARRLATSAAARWRVTDARASTQALPALFASARAMSIKPGKDFKVPPPSVTSDAVGTGGRSSFRCARAIGDATRRAIARDERTRVDWTRASAGR